MTNKRQDIIDHSQADQLQTATYPPWLWDRLDEFQDRRFGLFVHWGPYCQWGCIES